MCFIITDVVDLELEDLNQKEIPSSSKVTVQLKMSKRPEVAQQICPYSSSDSDEDDVA